MEGIYDALTDFFIRAARNGEFNQPRVVSALLTITPSFESDRIFWDVMPSLGGMFHCQVMMGKYPDIAPPKNSSVFGRLPSPLTKYDLPAVTLAEAKAMFETK